MKLTVRLFAAAKQLLGQDTIAIELSRPATVAQLRRALETAHPKLQPLLAHSRFAVNSDYVPETTDLQEQDEIALIPPVSGG